MNNTPQTDTSMIRTDEGWEMFHKTPGVPGITISTSGKYPTPEAARKGVGEGARMSHKHYSAALASGQLDA